RPALIGERCLRRHREPDRLLQLLAVGLLPLLEGVDGADDALVARSSVLIGDGLLEVVVLSADQSERELLTDLGGVRDRESCADGGPAPDLDRLDRPDEGAR